MKVIQGAVTSLGLVSPSNSGCDPTRQYGILIMFVVPVLLVNPVHITE